MSTLKQRQQLRRLHRERRRQTDILVECAVRRLLDQGRPITFASVAEEAAVTKATIYRHLELRTTISRLRQQKESLDANGPYSPQT